MSTQTICDVPVDEIEPECNDRTTFDEAELLSLAASIRANGLLQPITIRPRRDGVNGFHLVAGERRWRAHLLNNAETIRAIIDDLDDDRASSAMLTENVTRVDLSPIEEARAYRKRLDAGLTVEELSEQTGIKTARIGWRLDLLKLTPELQQLTDTGELKPGFAWELRNLDANRQRIAFRALSEQNLDWYSLHAFCDKLLAEQLSEPLFDADGFLQTEVYDLTPPVVVRRLGLKGLRAMVAQLADALETAGAEPELVAEARSGL